MESKYSVVVFICVISSTAVLSQVPDITVSPKNVVLNEGDTFTAYCNVPGITTLQMVNEYPAEWFRGNTRLTYLSSIEQGFKDKGYTVEVGAQKDNPENLTVTLTIQSIKAAEEGTYTCKVKTAEQSLQLKIRRPIQEMEFSLHQNHEHAQTMNDPARTKKILIDQGGYKPLCSADGSFPKPTVKIFLGNEELRGTSVVMQGKSGNQFLANEINFSPKDNGQILKCIADVPGLIPVNKVERSFEIEVRKLDPVFRCDNTSAIPGNRRHMMTCYISNVENIDCKYIIWERLDTAEEILLGDHPKYEVKCYKEGNETRSTLEIKEVKQEHFKAEWAIKYRFIHGDSNRFISTLSQISNSASSLYSITSLILLLSTIVFLS